MFKKLPLMVLALVGVFILSACQQSDTNKPNIETSDTETPDVAVTPNPEVSVTTPEPVTPLETTTPPVNNYPATARVSIANFAFSGSSIIKQNGTVTWKNNDSVVHTVTGSGFDSGTIQPGGSYSHTFTATGTYDYYCAFHPSMIGSVTVK